MSVDAKSQSEESARAWVDRMCASLGQPMTIACSIHFKGGEPYLQMAASAGTLGAVFASQTLDAQGWVTAEAVDTYFATAIGALLCRLEVMLHERQAAQAAQERSGAALH